MDGLQGVTPAMLADQATQNDLVRRKVEMDDLRKRLGDTKTKEQKLRESCEGFEAIFLQKMWEQMRKTVPKEGYLHSKDEDTYQSLFDVELCKKMAGAGGMGLADMLYEQLSQQLADSGRTTSPGSYRIPLEIAPAGLGSPKKTGAPEAGTQADKKLTAADLYTPLAPQEKTNEAETPGKSIKAALHDLKAALDKSQGGEAGAAVREWAAARDRATRNAPALDFSAAEKAPAADKSPGPDRDAKTGREPGLAAPAATSGNSAAPHGASPLAGAGNNPATGAAAQAGTPAASVGKSAAPDTAGNAGQPAALAESADPAAVKNRKSSGEEARRLFGRKRKTGQVAKSEVKNAPAQPRGMVPQGTLWPLAGEGGAVVSHFGWEDDKAGGSRRWNSGIRIAAGEQNPVRAVLAGTVVYAGEREGYGHTVVMEHKDGFRSYYSNLADSSVRVGDVISRGAEFAKVAVPTPSQAQGAKSASLYFELKKGEMALNPENAIERHGVS